MGAGKLWGEVGRWLVIALIQIFKYVRCQFSTGGLIEMITGITVDLFMELFTSNK